MIIYRSSEARREEIVAKRKRRSPSFPRSFRRGGKKKNSTIPRGRIIPPYGDKGLVRGVSYVSINLLGCSTSTTIMVTPMLRVPDNYYKKWRRTPGASSPCCKLVSSSSIRIETSNLSDKRM